MPVLFALLLLLAPLCGAQAATLADWVGACVAALSPLAELIRRHVLDAARIHGDDTTVPVLAKGKTVIGRLWTYVRDDRPFGGPDPPAAVYFYSRNRDDFPVPGGPRTWITCRSSPAVATCSSSWSTPATRRVR